MNRALLRKNSPVFKSLRRKRTEQIFLPIPMQESWDTIEAWLKSIGKSDEVDMKKEVRIATEQLGTDENEDWFLLYDHMSELDSGTGAFLSNNKCHILILANGICSMSDGKITEYMGYTTKAKHDALGTNTEDVVETGTFSGMKDKTYELIDGELSVQEGSELVKEYFMAGTPFPCADNVTIDIPEVNVFRLGDVYGYDYMLRRAYCSVPFVYMDYGNFQVDADYSPCGDIKHAYVVDDSGVTSFVGYNEAEKLISLAVGQDIIGLEQMAEMVSEKLASSISVHVESAGLVYFPVHFDSFESEESNLIIPCWEIAGTDGSNGKGIRIYCDVFTGDVYYYTFRMEE